MPTRLIALEPQHPSASLDHALDFTSYLATGDTLTGTPTVTAAAGLTVHNGSDKPGPAIVGTTVVFWLSGGTAGTQYNGACAFETKDGREDVAEWQIQIIDPTP